jgi:hypothetical protein
VRAASPSKFFLGARETDVNIAYLRAFINMGWQSDAEAAKKRVKAKAKAK